MLPREKKERNLILRSLAIGGGAGIVGVSLLDSPAALRGILMPLGALIGATMGYGFGRLQVIQSRRKPARIKIEKR